MTETIELGDICIAVTRKPVKNVHLSVHPPDGHVTLVAPSSTRLEVARAYAISKLAWIKTQQAALTAQQREPARKFIGRESHYVWGRRYLMTVIELDQKPSVVLDHRTIRLSIRPGGPPEKRAEVMHEWHKSLLHRVVPSIIRKWEQTLGVSVSRYFLQRMKTKWGGCTPEAGTIRLNTELVRKPKDLLEYVIVHEMMHLIEPKHSPRFFELMTEHYPAWPEARRELNELPLADELWKLADSP
ncbi:metal-dependent hydrolase [Rhizobium sp. Leaf311]|uniref:M48 family metallopeptidase n=1 Tax=Rhizobium sp. Leaf311 TaxID=1736332 RepID=UPI000714CA0C|nr:SprT family zinc-dependent metalloprotease [Rhizobium sp. Leaf311]KQQ59544.1 metal-dependent hydrolase [Rhizobium sp. Leaf311]